MPRARWRSARRAKEYEARRLPAANKMVLTNREYSPDFIIIKVGRPAVRGTGRVYHEG
jgi:hypothetical protein